MIRNKTACYILLTLLLMPALLLAGCSGTYLYQPSGLPSLIAFSSDREGTVHIYTCDTDGGDVKSMSEEVQVLDGLPRWSPDGKRMVFSSNQSGDFEVWSMNAEGGDRLKLSDGRGWDGLARYSPDGSQIVFTGGRTSPAGNDYYEIFVMKSNGTDIVQLTDTTTWEQPAAGAGAGQGHSDEVKVPWNSVPTWSPDGTKILFATNRASESAVPVLYIMNPNGSDQRPFGFPFSIDGTGPDWSPVTNQIVFSRGTAAKGEIWVMDGGFLFPTFTARKLLANIHNNHSPSWSPDGKQIVFVSDEYSKDDIFTMNADGTSVKRITYDNSNDRYPTWR